MKITDAITIGIVGLIGVGLFKLMGGFAGIKDFQELFGGGSGETPPVLTPDVVKEALQSGGQVSVTQVETPQGISPLGILSPIVGVSEVLQHISERARPPITTTIIGKAPEPRAIGETLTTGGTARVQVYTFPHEEAGKTSRFIEGQVPSYQEQRTAAIEKYGKIGGR